MLRGGGALKPGLAAAVAVIDKGKLNIHYIIESRASVVLSGFSFLSGSVLSSF